MGWQWERLLGVSTNSRHLKGLQKGSYLLQFSRSESTRQEKGLGFKERV